MKEMNNVIAEHNEEISFIEQNSGNFKMRSQAVSIVDQKRDEQCFQS